MKDKIVVFDSGLGGLNIYNALCNKYPNENYVYFADELYLPYGTKSIDFLKQRIKGIIEYFKDAKAIIIACNTASSIYALLDIDYDNVYEIIDVTSQYAYRKSNNKRIGIIATNLTIELGMYQNKLLSLNATPYALKYSELVNFIENRINLSDEEYLKLVNESLNEKFKFFEDTNIDTLICGCTHFGYLIDEYKKHLNVANYITSEEAMIDYLDSKIKFKNLDISTKEIYTSGDKDEFEKKLKKMSIFANVGHLEIKH